MGNDTNLAGKIEHDQFTVQDCAKLLFSSVTNDPNNLYKQYGFSLAKSVLQERKLCLLAPLKSFMATPCEATCHVTTAHALFLLLLAIVGRVYFLEKIV